MEYKPYKHLPPFKGMVLQNFPFIEDDFDAITNYQLLCKVVEYLKNIQNNEIIMEENVNNLYIAFSELKEYVDNYFNNLDVQEEINNKLDSMVEDGTLSEIINQEIFSSINKKLDDKLNISFLSIGNNSVSENDTRHLGDCCVIHGDKNIIVDVGFQTNCAKLINFLTTNNITKIDRIIITHFHSDHIGGANASGLQALLNTDSIDFSECIAYLPHKNINYNEFLGTVGTTVSNDEETVKNMLTNKGIEYYYPNNEEEIKLTDEISLTFYNIGENFYNEYYDTTINWRLTTQEFTNYNNFSMVTLLKHYNNKILLTGDLEEKSESLVYTYIPDIDVLKVEHHGLNYNSDVNYLSRLNPKYAVICDLDDEESKTLLHNTLFNLLSKKATVFRTQEAGDVTIISTYQEVYTENKKAIDLYNYIYNLYEGKPILNSEDLDDIITPGIYNSMNSDNTNTLINCPVTNSGFKLIVERLTQSNNAIRQIIYRNNVDSAIYVRSYVGGVFGKWKELKIGISFSVDNTSFTMGEYDITFTTTNHETRYECKNNVCSLSLTFMANEEIATGQDIFILPTSLIINGETITIDYGNKIINFNMTDTNGNVYPMYLGGGKNLRARKVIPENANIRGNVSFILN